MDFRYNSEILEIEASSKNKVFFDEKTGELKIEDLNISHPWEYEKSGILVEVKKYGNNLFYSFSIDSKHVLFVLNDDFELKEEILTFFGDVDVLVIVWTKKSTKIFENIEARVVIPYWEGKDLFLQTLWQNLEEVKNFKTKWELPTDTTEFINLAK